MAIEALKNRIINADFRDVLKELPDKSVDLLLTDPPYAIDIVRQLVKKDPYQKHGYKSWELKEWDKERPTKKDFEEMIRVSKNQIIWGGELLRGFIARKSRVARLEQRAKRFFACRRRTCVDVLRQSVKNFRLFPRASIKGRQNPPDTKTRRAF